MRVNLHKSWNCEIIFSTMCFTVLLHFSRVFNASMLCSDLKNYGFSLKYSHGHQSAWLIIYQYP